MTTQPNWIPSPTEFATIIDAETGKQVADFGSPQLDEAAIERNLKLGLAAPRLLAACDLVQRAHVGDGVSMAEAVDACLLAIVEAEGRAG
jgi:hypothetical protein